MNILLLRCKGKNQNNRKQCCRLKKFVSNLTHISILSPVKVLLEARATRALLSTGDSSLIMKRQKRTSYIYVPMSYTYHTSMHRYRQTGDEFPEQELHRLPMTPLLGSQTPALQLYPRQREYSWQLCGKNLIYLPKRRYTYQTRLIVSGSLSRNESRFTSSSYRLLRYLTFGVVMTALWSPPVANPTDVDR